MEVWIWNIPGSDPLQRTFFVLEVEPWNIPDSNLPWESFKGSDQLRSFEASWVQRVRLCVTRIRDAMEHAFSVFSNDDCYRASLAMHTDAASLSDFFALL